MVGVLFFPMVGVLFFRSCAETGRVSRRGLADRQQAVSDLQRLGSDQKETEFTERTLLNRQLCL